jgi:hypothetical protein
MRPFIVFRTGSLDLATSAEEHGENAYILVGREALSGDLVEACIHL